MARSLRKLKGRHGVRLHIQVFRDVLDSPQYAVLSPRAVKLLLDIHAQYRGYNNGDLSVAWKLMRRRGWTSKDQLRKARDELLAAKFIAVSRWPRARRQPVLYYLTFEAINDCGGKLDVQPTRVPSNEWRAAPQERMKGRAVRKWAQEGAHGDEQVLEARNAA